MSSDHDQQMSVLDTPGFALGVADQVSAALWRETIEPLLTQPQFLALSELCHAPGASQYELADSVGIDRATIGPLVKRLEDLRWILRQRDPRDARRAVLEVAPAGLAVLREATPLADTVTDAFMTPLTHTEQAVVVQSWAMLGHVTAAGARGRGGGSPDVRPPAIYPWFFLRIARRRYRRIWRETASDSITPSQFALMSLVESHPLIDIRTAAERAFVEESTAVRIVMRTVRLRLMRDSRDPADARRSLLRLTDTGRTQFADVASRLKQVQDLFCDGIPSRALLEFSRLTRRIARLPEAANEA